MREEGNVAAWEDDGHCYVCGAKNAQGLRLRFSLTDSGIETEFVAEKRHQGYRDVLHGGILMMVMDEVMVMLPYLRFGEAYASAELTVKLKEPAPVGDRIRVTACFEGNASPGRRLYRLRSEASLGDGTLAATGLAKCIRVGGRTAA